MSDLIPSEVIARRIFVLRGSKVMLDVDLAELYGVEVRTLNQAVKRNAARFPADFMFELTEPEWLALRSQVVILDPGRGQHRKYLPHAFSEQGVAMLSSVLRSEQAVQVNIAIMRAFVKMREAMAGHVELARRLDEMEARYDGQFQAVFDAIRMLMLPGEAPSKPMGFRTD